MFKDKKIERYLSEQELLELGRALWEAEKEGINTYAIAAIRLLLLTGVRKNEILSLRWEWVDFDRSLLTLPDSKTGAKIIPLGDATIDVFRTIPRELNCPFVFPGSGGNGHLIGLQKIWEKIRPNAGLAFLRLHDASPFSERRRFLRRKPLHSRQACRSQETGDYTALCPSS